MLDTIPEQPLHLAVVLAGERERSGWWGSGREAGWSDAIALVRRLADELSVELDVRSAAYAPWHPGRCAALLRRRHRSSATPASCTRRSAARWASPPVRAALEIDLDVLMAHAPETSSPARTSRPTRSPRRTSPWSWTPR